MDPCRLAQCFSGDAGAPDGGDAGRTDGGLPKAGPAMVHFITTIFLRAVVNGTESVVGLWEFKATDPAPPTVQFTLPCVTSVAVSPRRDDAKARERRSPGAAPRAFRSFARPV